MNTVFVIGIVLTALFTWGFYRMIMRRKMITYRLHKNAGIDDAKQPSVAWNLILAFILGWFVAGLTVAIGSRALDVDLPEYHEGRSTDSAPAATSQGAADNPATEPAGNQSNFACDSEAVVTLAKSNVQDQVLASNLGGRAEYDMLLSISAMSPDVTREEIVAQWAEQFGKVTEISNIRSTYDRSTGILTCQAKVHTVVGKMGGLPMNYEYTWTLSQPPTGGIAFSGVTLRRG